MSERKKAVVRIARRHIPDEVRIISEDIEDIYTISTDKKLPRKYGKYLIK